MSDRSLRLRTPGTVTIGRDSPQPGGWFGAKGKAKPQDSRARMGFGPSDVLNAPGQLSLYTNERLLLPHQYYQLYHTSPDVRACVDSITRRIATWDWGLKVSADPRDKKEYKRLADKAKKAARWLQFGSNVNGETWQELLTRTITDLLLYEAGVWELNMKGRALNELVPWLGSAWFPYYNDKNILEYYQQEQEGIAASNTVKVPPERMVYFSLFRNNRTVLGMPLLDTLVNELVTVLLASERAMIAIDANEIPPGLLVLGGVGGAAAERARADLQQMKGRDHRLRVISSPMPNGIKAEWVELKHTLKDIELLKVVESMRRTIWRVFGVMPVELGEADGIPRAHAEVQVDVSSSHLITPILELLQARINAQVIPLLVGEKDSEDIAFRFDRDQQLTPAQQLDLARAQDRQVRRGIITVNEARADLDRLPVDGGDVSIVDTNEGPVPLTQVAAGLDGDGEEDPDDDPEDEDPDDDPDDDDDTPEELDPEDEKTIAGLESSHQKRVGRCSAHALGDADLSALRARLSSTREDDFLPSDWPEASKFDGYRTLDLNKLARVVADYGMAVSEIYSQANEDVQAILLSAYGDDEILELTEGARAKLAMDARLDELAESWSVLTAPLYHKAATIGREGAEGIAGGLVDTDSDTAARLYHDEAMSYLVQPDGLIGTLKELSRRTVDAATVGRSDTASPEHRDRIDDLSPDDGSAGSLNVLDASFVAQSHRIDNWSGRMVGLSNDVLVDGLKATVSTDGDGRAVQWWTEWVTAGGKSCTICADEGSQGFRLLSSIARRPGEDTFCVGRCRCVLTFWTKEEVDSGAAVSLSALAPGGPDA